MYSNDQCGQMLRDDMTKKYGPQIYACVKDAKGNHVLMNPVKRNYFAALLDAAYNAGPSAACKSPMAADYRSGAWKSACKRFLGWHTLPGNAAHNGLERRREWEGNVLCGMGDYHAPGG